MMGTLGSSGASTPEDGVRNLLAVIADPQAAQKRFEELEAKSKEVDAKLTELRELERTTTARQIEAEAALTRAKETVANTEKQDRALAAREQALSKSLDELALAKDNFATEMTKALGEHAEREARLNEREDVLIRRDHDSQLTQERVNQTKKELESRLSKLQAAMA